jgi:UDP:flavonoid glycosyltransferase YjiC (YdhE family)
MARVLVITAPELGHLLPVIPIAEHLRTKGHDLCFVVTAGLKSVVDQYGFVCELWEPSSKGQEAEHITASSGWV